jgi:tetratricopeptide (TPR) repeat protein
MAQKRHESRRVTRTVAGWARRHLGWWIFAAGAVDAALLTAVVVLITFPGQSRQTASGLLVTLVVLLVFSVAFPLAGRVVEKRDREAELAAERERARGDREAELAAERERARCALVDQLLVQGSAAGLPRLSEVTNDVLGVTPTRYSGEGAAPYVRRREADAAIRGMLHSAGPLYPFVIVWGTTKAGKSRTLAEALRATFTDDPAVVVPRDGQALAELARQGIDSLVDNKPAVVVLDDLDPAGLGALTTEVLGLVRSWAVIAATMTAKRRSDVETSDGEVGRNARSALADSAQYELASEPPTGAERAEAERLYPAENFDGSIAEVLVGAQQLLARYRAAPDEHPAGCAVVQAAVDARRVGVSRPLKDAELRRLFPRYLQAIRVGLLPTDDSFTAGISWAAHPVASQVALLKQANPGRNPPEWVVFDHAVTADEGYAGYHRRLVPDETWTELIGMLPPEDAFPIGITTHDHETEIAAFRKAASSGQANVSGVAAYNLGLLLEAQGDRDEARAAYQQAVDSGHPDAAPMARLNIGNLLMAQDDLDGARAAFQAAVDSGHPDAAPMARANLGLLLEARRDLDGARAAYQAAVDSGHPDAAPNGRLNIGNLLRAQDDLDGARAAFQAAVDSGHPDAAPKAALSLGMLLEAQDDLQGAQTAYRTAIASGHADAAPTAALRLGTLFARQRDLGGARAAYQVAIDSGHSDEALMAALDLGQLLLGQGDLQGAQNAYQHAANSRNANAAMGTLGLGTVLRMRGDADGARAAYQVAIDSGHVNAAPRAAYGLGSLLEAQGDLDGARAAYQQAIDSGNAEVAPIARQSLDRLV